MAATYNGHVSLPVFCNAGRSVWELPFSRGYFGVYVALADSVFIDITELSASDSLFMDSLISPLLLWRVDTRLGCNSLRHSALSLR